MIDAFESLFRIINTLGIIALIFVPLGLWKLIDLIIWLINHIRG